MTRAAALGLVVTLALAAGPAAAEHEVFYRYTVLGFVKDGAGRPVGARSVELVRDKTGFSYVTETDEQGLYILVARLGDEGAGERLTLRVGGASATVRAQFDPLNHTDERGTRVDVEGARFIERRAWFRSTLVKVLTDARR